MFQILRSNKQLLATIEIECHLTPRDFMAHGAARSTLIIVLLCVSL